MSEDYKDRIGKLIRDARKHRGLTQLQLADLLATSQSAINRIEKGHQNLSLEMLARIGAALDSEIVAVGAGPDPPARHRADRAVRQHRREDLQERRRRPAVRLPAQPGPHHPAQGRPDRGGQPAARGARPASASRPAGSTATTTWRSSRPATLDLEHIDEDAARRTRSVIMFLGPLLHRADTFELPYAGGCNLGTRTVEPHMAALRPFGLEVKATDGSYHAAVNRAIEPEPADRAHRARRHRHRERPDGRRAAPGHHRHPQRLLELHGPGPLLLPAEARRRRSRASAPPR